MSRKELFYRSNPEQIGAMLVCLMSVPGMAVSVFLTLAKFRSEYRCDSSILSACSFGEWFDCNRVLDSPWATPIYRLPISVYSTAYYLVLFGLGLAALWYPTRLLPVVRPMILWLAWVGLLAVVCLMMYAYHAVESACSYCIIVYGITFTTFLAAWLMNPRGHLAGLRELFSSSRRRGAVGFLAFLAFLALVSAQMVQYFGSVNRVEFDRCLSESFLPPSSLQTEVKRPRAQISVFLDLACEFCRREYDGWRVFVAQHPEEYRLVVYHYVRAGACVPPRFPWQSAKAERNNSCEAAQAVECVEKLLPAGGLPMVDALFKMQERESPFFNELNLAEAAREAGLKDVPLESRDHPFFECIKGRAMTSLIAEHAYFAMEQGNSSTPVTYLTFFDDKGQPLPRMIHIKGAKNYGSVERTLAIARRAAEGASSGAEPKVPDEE